MPRLTAGLFDGLEDESPVSIGKEIGTALSGALKDIAKSQEKQAETTAQTIESVVEKAADKLSEVVGKQVPAVPLPKPITEWDFDIQRDNKGLMTRVVAKANP